MAESTAVVEPRAPNTPWFPFLAGPVIGVLHQAIGYPLVAWSCTTGALGFSLGPLSGIGLVVVGITVVAEAILIAAIVSGLRAYREASDWPEEGEGRSVGRVRFMALVGVVLSAGFALYALYVGVAALVLDPCVFL